MSKSTPRSVEHACAERLGQQFTRAAFTAHLTDLDFRSIERTSTGRLPLTVAGKPIELSKHFERAE